MKIAATKEAESKTSKNDLIISLATTTVGNSPSVEKNPMLQLANDNPLGIKIKEITKPEEIRITDDKPKPFNPFKSTSTTTTTTTTTTTATPSTTTTVKTSTEAITKISSTTELMSTSTVSSTSTEIPRDSNETTEDTNQSNGDHESRDYVSDDALFADASNAPPTKASKEEGEVEPQVLLGSADSNTIGDDTGNKSVRQTVESSTSNDFDQSSESSSEFYSSTTESAIESSTPLSDATSTESSGEAVDLVSSTPKNLVVVRHGGKTESFHISGTDGLQRVEEPAEVLSSTTENSQEVGEAAIQSSSLQPDFGSSTVDGFDSFESRSREDLVMENSSSTTGTPENFEETGTVSPALDKKLDNTLNLNVNDNSTEILTNNSIEVSTPVSENSVENSSEILLPAEQVYGTVYYGEDRSTASPSSEEAFETVYYGSTEDVSDSSSTTDDLEASSTSDSSASSTTTASISVTESSSATKTTSTEPVSESTSRFSFGDEDDTTLPENPEYPPIPDDLSLTHKDDEERRSPSKVIEDSVVSSTAGPCDECESALKSIELSTQGPTLEEIKLSHESDSVESRAPGEPLLIPEWERTTTTTQKPEESTTLGPKETVTAVNEISKTAIFDRVVKTNKSEALTNIETLPNDVDSDEKYGRKEPTTERPTTKGYASADLSEEGSAASSLSEYEGSTVAGATDPKDDAESIKYNSSGADSVSNESYSLEGPFVAKWPQPDIMGMNYWRNIGRINGWVTRK